jgi:hypothetical protein
MTATQGKDQSGKIESFFGDYPVEKPNQFGYEAETGGNIRKNLKLLAIRKNNANF